MNEEVDRLPLDRKRFRKARKKLTFERRSFRRHLEKMRVLATKDNLTGVYNRTGFEEEFGKALAHSKRTKEALSLLFVDLTRFKTINDKFGHLAGDQALKTFARSLVSALRQGDIVGRVGGDEFAAIMMGTNKIEAEKAVERLKTTPFKVTWNRQEINIPAAFGIAVYPQDGEKLENLIKKADSWMYNDKSKRGSENG